LDVSCRINKQNGILEMKNIRIVESLRDVQSCLSKIQEDAELLDGKSPIIKRIRSSAFMGMDLVNKTIRMSEISDEEENSEHNNKGD